METATIATVEFKINIQLTEVEARALDAIVGYGIKPFLEVFYPKMGEAYLKKHEAGAKTLFEHVRTELGQQLNNIDKAKQAINNLNVITPIQP